MRHGNGKGSVFMSTGIVAKLREGVTRLFPDRQIYHRSRGEVHFITVAARTQIILIMGTLAFLTWVAFTSVNVVFKDQIIAAKDRRYNEMNANFQTRIDRLRGEIDDVNGILRHTQDRFSEELELLEERQNRVDQLVEDQEVLMLEHEELRNRVAIMGTDPMAVNPDGTSVLHMAVENREPSLRRARPLPPVRASVVDGVSTILASVAQGGGYSQDALTTRSNRIARLEAASLELRTRQRDTILALDAQASDQLARLETILESTGLNVDQYVTAFLQDSFSGVGGPAMELDHLGEYTDEDMDTEEFMRHLVRTSNHLDRLAVVQAAMSNLPLVRPTDIYRLSDGYGMRRDPFTRRMRMHHGLDFAGPSGTPVMATASGTVVRAGTQSGYGRIVVIDHGNGIETRYAHLRRTEVSVGDEVETRQVIGQLGNTGRSTGPHVHYEIRYQNEALDPLPFLEAGRHVFES